MEDPGEEEPLGLCEGDGRGRQDSGLSSLVVDVRSGKRTGSHQEGELKEQEGSEGWDPIRRRKLPAARLSQGNVTGRDSWQMWWVTEGQV